MSIPSKITLGLACAASASIIGYVHYKQNNDREKLHEGVVRDIERQQRRKVENTYELQKQIDLTKQLRNIQAQNQSGEDASTNYKSNVEKVINTNEVEKNNKANNVS